MTQRETAAAAGHEKRSRLRPTANTKVQTEAVVAMTVEEVTCVVGPRNIR